MDEGLEVIKYLGRGLVLEFLTISTDRYHGLVRVLVWPRKVVWIAGPRGVRIPRRLLSPTDLWNPSHLKVFKQLFLTIW